jgi:hypothetical protein
MPPYAALLIFPTKVSSPLQAPQPILLCSLFEFYRRLSVKFLNLKLNCVTRDSV